MTENSGYNGQMKVSDASGSFNAQNFAISQLINKINTATLVRVVKCTNEGSLNPVGFVDIQPLVNQVDGQGEPISHGTVYGLPYLRIQGGTNAIVIDPQVGDIGLAVFASRDISKVKTTKDKALPGSARKYSFSDGIYLGGLLNAIPQQYVQFEATGITILSPQKVTVTAPVVEVNASASVDITSPTTTINGDLVVTGSITGDDGASINGDVSVVGKVTATGFIESAAGFKVGGVTLTVP